MLSFQDGDVLNDLPVYEPDVFEALVNGNGTSRVGKGGWGCAYSAVSVKPLPRYAWSCDFHALVESDTPLCVKYFHRVTDESDTPSLPSSFLQEVRHQALLSDHPNIAPVYGLGVEDGRLFSVMPLYQIGSLEQHIAERALRYGDGAPAEEDSWWSEVFQILLSVAQGLAHMESKKFVHRDVKPANILLGEDLDQVVLSDFGLAIATDSLALVKTPSDKRKACRLGTTGFISPELQKFAALPSHKSDVWSFGMVAYCCAAMSMRVPQEAPFASSPRWLQSLIWHCCRCDPSLRPAATQIVDWLKTNSVPDFVRPPRAASPAYG